MTYSNIRIADSGGKVILANGKGDLEHGVLKAKGNLLGTFDGHEKYRISGDPNLGVTATWLDTTGPTHTFKVD